jgi:hypothetical protein
MSSEDARLSRKGTSLLVETEGEICEEGEGAVEAGSPAQRNPRAKFGEVPFSAFPTPRKRRAVLKATQVFIRELQEGGFLGDDPAKPLSRKKEEMSVKPSTDPSKIG